jgi:transcriptional regulator with XRE-family HTH domain
MNAPGSPTVRRRRLAAELRGIRESKGKSGDAVAAALKWSPSKISRYERARTGLRPREVERLLDYYQITGPRRELLLGLAEDAAQKGWWEEYADTLSEDYQQFIGLEHEATSMAIWHVDVVTGLFQTEGYARHIISSYSRVEPVAPGMIGRQIGVRMQRQQVLAREGLQLSLVLDESILKRRIGDDAVMYEQLQRLAREAPSSRSGPTGWPTCWHPRSAPPGRRKVVWCGQNSIGAVGDQRRPQGRATAVPAQLPPVARGGAYVTDHSDAFDRLRRRRVRPMFERSGGIPKVQSDPRVDGPARTACSRAPTPHRRPAPTEPARGPASPGPR